MAAIVTSLIAIILRYTFLSDVAGALPTTQRGISDPADLPPVIYNQTMGPMYITDHNQYYTLYCYGTEGAKVTWTYNGQNISDPEVYDKVYKSEGVQFHEVSENSLLVFDQHKRAIHGYIQCFVTNSRGSTFGDKVFITHAVLALDPEGELDTTIIETVGNTVTLSCDSHVEDLPDALVTWHHKDTQGKQHDINPTSRPDFFCNGDKTVCVISHVKLEDEGEYKCSYRIPGRPQGLSKNFMVIVESSEYPNRMHPLNLIAHVSSPSKMKVKVGEMAELQCAFRGNTNKTVRWTRTEGYNDCGFKDLAELDNNTLTAHKYAFESDGTIFRISNFSAADEGYYLCVADNGYDQYAHRIRVHMVVPPVLTEKIYGVQTYLGGTVRLNCSVSDSVPAVSVTWWVNQEVVLAGGLRSFRLEDGGATLALYNASLEDTSGVTCNVSNEEGSMLGYRYIVVQNITLPVTETSTTVTTIDTTKENDMTETETIAYGSVGSSTDPGAPTPDVVIATSFAVTDETEKESQSEQTQEATSLEHIITSVESKNGQAPYQEVTNDEIEAKSPTDPSYKTKVGQSG